MPNNTTVCTFTSIRFYKSRTARPDKNTNSCPKTCNKTVTGYIFYHTSKILQTKKTTEIHLFNAIPKTFIFHYGSRIYQSSLNYAYSHLPKSTIMLLYICFYTTLYFNFSKKYSYFKRFHFSVMHTWCESYYASPIVERHSTSPRSVRLSLCLFVVSLSHIKTLHF